MTYNNEIKLIYHCDIHYLCSVTRVDQTLNSLFDENVFSCNEVNDRFDCL